ncbi:MAG TPA: iron-sulfur cluster assembly accessory protein [Planctomycetota bacterium]|nr:iron-sulfur cluster assembly accessory protein [Planctomycetota bacterium]
MPSMTISEKAAAKGKDLVRAEAVAMREPGLRVRVVGGGCSGLMYKMEIGDGAGEGDETFERDGFRVYIDKKSLFFLNGSELDYSDGLTGAGFKFKNPNVKGSCGCGESFSV